MSEQAVLWLSVLVCVVSLLLVAGVIWFGFSLSERRFWPWPHPYTEQLLGRLLNDDRNTRLQAVRALADLCADSRARRNEFWITYGQIVLSLFLITILSVLLLTKTIDPDAGLPILAAVSGFTIAKAVNTTRDRGNLPAPPEQER